MPDPNRKTISASQVAGLFGQSPYVTRLALYHWVRTGLDIDSPDNFRMRLGRLLEDDILTLVQEHYALDVKAVQQGPESYVTHPEYPIGTTLDAWLSCPTRGIATVQAKNVDYLVWRKEWTFDDENICVAAPPHIEIQVQTEMLATEAKWGVIAALVGGNDLILIERKPDVVVQTRIVEEVKSFLDDCANDREPPAQGRIDYDIIAKLIPESFAREACDLRTGPTGERDTHTAYISMLGVAYERVKADRLALEKEEKALKGRLLDLGRRVAVNGTMPPVVLTDEGTLKLSRGKDTYYQHPEGVKSLLHHINNWGIDEDNGDIALAVDVVKAAERKVSRKGGYKVDWKEA